MEQVGFIGSYDKKDLLLSIGKVLVSLNHRVLIIDATLLQRLKYIVPNVSNNNSPTYISEYQGMDVAVGFMNYAGIAQYLNSTQIPYEFIFVDSDNPQTMNSFMIPRFKKIYFVTSYDQYEISRTIESLKILNQPMEVSKVVFSASNTQQQADYLQHLIETTPVRFGKQVVAFADTVEDRKATLENQLMKEIKMKRYTNTYRDSLEYITALVSDGIVNRGEIKRIMKKI